MQQEQTIALQPCVFIKLCSNFSQKCYKALVLHVYQILSTSEIRLQSCVFIKFFSHFAQKCNKVIYSLAYLSSFAQTLPTSEIRLQSCVSTFDQILPKSAMRIYQILPTIEIRLQSCIFIKFCSNFAQKCNKFIALRIYHISPQNATRLYTCIALPIYQILLKLCPKVQQGLA